MKFHNLMNLTTEMTAIPCFFFFRNRTKVLNNYFDSIRKLCCTEISIATFNDAYEAVILLFTKFMSPSP